MLIQFAISVLLLFSVPAEPAKTMGPVGNIIINSIFECDQKPPGNDVTLATNLKSVDDKGTKMLSATFTSKIVVDDTVKYDVELRKQESGTWRTIITQKGVACKDIQKIFAKVYTRARAAIKPPIPAPCPVKPGKYVLTDFQATAKDVTIPTIFYGHFKITIKLLKDSKLLICKQAEFDSQAP